MRWFICALISSGLCFAQLRSFQIDLPDYQISDAIVSKAQGDTVSVFLECQDNLVRHFYYDLINNQPLAVPSIVGTWEGLQVMMLDGQLLEDGRWVCIGKSQEVIGSDSLLHYGWLTVGHPNGQQNTDMILHSIERDATFDSGGPLVDARIAEAPGGGYLATATGVGRWGVEPVSGVRVYSDLEISGWSTGDHECFAYPNCWSADSMDVLVSRNIGGNVYARFVINCDTCQEAEFITEGDWSCYTTLLMTTGSGRRLASDFVTLYEVNDDGECVELGDFATPEDFYYPSTPHISTAPDFGFAMLAPYLYETLWRVDTNGVVYDIGNVHFNGSGHRLKMNRQGDVIVTSHTGARVYCTIVPWDVLLDADHNGIKLPESYKLSAYPNPFNANVQIEYELPHAGDVQLSIHNTLGQQVATLFKGRATAGAHSLNWSPAAASGVYFVKLVSGEFVTSQKILYVR